MNTHKLAEKIVVAALVMMAGQAVFAAGGVDAKAPDPQLVAAHQYATVMLHNAVPNGATAEAQLMRTGESFWVCAVTVTYKNRRTKVETVSDISSPERACTQAVLKLARTKGL